MTLQEAFAGVEDHRRGPAQRYDLKEMIVMAICAVRCGAVRTDGSMSRTGAKARKTG
ncbi:MAG: transposase family protein [Rhodoferax sp.]|nr:transposase family protein [Rhodoferax sp.]